MISFSAKNGFALFSVADVVLVFVYVIEGINRFSFCSVTYRTLALFGSCFDARGSFGFSPFTPRVSDCTSVTAFVTSGIASVVVNVITDLAGCVTNVTSSVACVFVNVICRSTGSAAYVTICIAGVGVIVSSFFALQAARAFFPVLFVVGVDPIVKGVRGSFTGQSGESGFYFGFGKVFLASRAIVVSCYACFKFGRGVNFFLFFDQIAVSMTCGNCFRIGVTARASEGFNTCFGARRILCYFACVLVSGFFALQAARAFFPVLFAVGVDPIAKGVRGSGDDKCIFGGEFLLSVEVLIAIIAEVVLLHTCLQLSGGMRCRNFFKMLEVVCIGVDCNNQICSLDLFHFFIEVGFAYAAVVMRFHTCLGAGGIYLRNLFAVVVARRLDYFAFFNYGFAIGAIHIARVTVCGAGGILLALKSSIFVSALGFVAAFIASCIFVEGNGLIYNIAISCVGFITTNILRIIYSEITDISCFRILKITRLCVNSKHFIFTCAYTDTIVRVVAVEPYISFSVRINN